MVKASEFQFYKSLWSVGGVDSLGGGISANLIDVNGENNIFNSATNSEAISGSTKYRIIYIKYLGTETAKSCSFVLFSGTKDVRTGVQWAFDPTAGMNGTAQQLTNENTAPTGSITWNPPFPAIPDTPNVGEMKTNDYFPVIIKYTIQPNTPTIENDFSLFRLYFKVTSGQSSDPDVPPPADNTSFLVTAVGDWGCEDKTDDMVALCKKQNPKFVLSLGDGSYGSSASCWLDKVDPIKNILKPTIGNHDADKSSKLNDIKDAFDMGKTYYSFTYENVLFLVMDDESVSFSSGSSQYNFVVDTLKNARKDADIDFIIVYMHHPWWGADSKHPYNEGDIVGIYHPIFDQYKVTMVLTGHNHNIQRTFPVKFNSGNHDNPNVQSTDADGPYPYDLGLVHAQIGTGGRDSGSDLYGLGSQPSFNAYQNEDDNGILVISFSDNNKTMTCKIINEDEDVLDTWSFTR